MRHGCLCGQMWLHMAFIPLVLALLALLASSTSFDQIVSDQFYDASSARFPAHDSSWLELFGHRIAKAAIWIGYADSLAEVHTNRPHETQINKARCRGEQAGPLPRDSRQ